MAQPLPNQETPPNPEVGKLNYNHVILMSGFRVFRNLKNKKGPRDCANSPEA